MTSPPSRLIENIDTLRANAFGTALGSPEGPEPCGLGPAGAIAFAATADQERRWAHLIEFARTSREREGEYQKPLPVNK
jgi:hypothetical protein